jgi:hypothetical protein
MSAPDSGPIVLKSLLDYTAPHYIVQMSEKMSAWFMKLLSHEMEAKDRPMDRKDLTNNGPVSEVLKAMETAFSLRLLNSRLPENVRLTPELFLLVLLMCDGTGPGRVVMWAFTLNRMQLKAPESVLTIAELANEFPMGFPTEEACKECWSAQKGENLGEKFDNGFDNPKFWN